MPKRSTPFESFLFWMGLELCGLSALLWFMVRGANDPNIGVAYGFVIGFAAIGVTSIAVSLIRSGVSWVIHHEVVR
jgi:hypothetical protein